MSSQSIQSSYVLVESARPEGYPERQAIPINNSPGLIVQESRKAENVAQINLKGQSNLQSVVSRPTDSIRVNGFTITEKIHEIPGWLASRSSTSSPSPQNRGATLFSFANQPSGSNKLSDAANGKESPRTSSIIITERVDPSVSSTTAITSSSSNQIKPPPLSPNLNRSIQESSTTAAELAAANQDNEKLQQRIRDLDDRFNRLAGDLRVVKELQESYEEKINKLSTELSAKKTLLRQATTANEQLRAENARLKTRLIQANPASPDEINTLRNQITNYQSSIASILESNLVDRKIKDLEERIVGLDEVRKDVSRMQFGFVGLGTLIGAAALGPFGLLGAWGCGEFLASKSPIREQENRAIDAMNNLKAQLVELKEKQKNFRSQFN
jgi:hypothetical protein